ncbi:50S ribosomal protein L11 methyltransferase [Fulvivirgaceae bacterium PWU5]|uniref:Ribosomal protein L11 methyltransferase n=1 Tax=Dawidia cretensis TaxID=2782350 RepID=A0AAP2DT57_9BACT|nr:50S ribosomal protein L11 methyltransferase [Dawidia cretensis]MBT1706913.1 50S ribosomal protein L11 methyltransferase [Dawidia cretensis]
MYYSRFQVTCAPEYSEILMAEMAEAGFDSFLETDTGFEAYVTLENYDKEKLEEIKTRYGAQTPLTFEQDKIEKRNWNEEWEQSYQPIIVDNRCLIRAAFHAPDAAYPYEIVITPKMSFGTGHHQTTYLMVKSQLDMDHRDKRVMDAGCGTAILSIMACKLGATSVEAFDIDEWSVINGQENIEVNGCTGIHLQQGKFEDLQPQGPFDIILANINKNVLLQEIKYYQGCLAPGGLLLLSGFYTHDIADIAEEAGRYGLRPVRDDARESWAAVLFKKEASVGQ